MRITLAWIVAALLCGACSTPGLAGALAIEAEHPFSLQPGDSGQWADARLLLGLDGVTADSRCPEGEQCVSAGDATVRVWWQRDGGPREVRDLHVASRGGVQTTRIGELELRLVALAPVRKAGRAIAARDYAATLVLSRNPSAEADR